MLARENLTEENWMHAAALSLLECNEEFRRGRAERLIPGAGLEEVQVPIGSGHMGGIGTTTQYITAPAPPEPPANRIEGQPGEQQGEGGELDTRTLEANNVASAKPMAVYEVHTGTLHCTSIYRTLKSDTHKLF
jgi:hypothetical protein